MPALPFPPLPRRALLGSAIRAAVFLGTIASSARSPTQAAEPPERVVDGLQSLYTFEALVNGVIPDRAGVGEGIDLRIGKPQGVRFQAGRMGLDLPVVIASDGPATRLTQALRQAQQFALEVWITPAEGEQTGPARIVSLSLDRSKRSFSLVQEKGRYELRLRTSTTSDNGTPATPTPDGTAVRDYLHVEDLARAHPDALDYLRRGGESTTLNVGYGHGYSVREVLAAVARAAGQPLTLREGPRRAGDPPELVSEASASRRVLGWQPPRDDLDLIVRSAIDWERKLPRLGWR